MQILGLRWDDLDLQRACIILHDTKNGDRRVLPLTGYALELMQQHATTRRADTALVLPDAAGIKLLSIRDAWKNAMQRAGSENLRYHDLSPIVRICLPYAAHVRYMCSGPCPFPMWTMTTIAPLIPMHRLSK